MYVHGRNWCCVLFRLVFEGGRNWCYVLFRPFFLVKKAHKSHAKHRTNTKEYARFVAF